MPLKVGRRESWRYVRRERSAEDRRREDRRLTPSGTRVEQRQNALEPELIAALLRRLSLRKHEQALRGLGLLAETASALIASGDLNRFLRGETAWNGSC
jgi:DNA-binding MarR family transcriptional regulator